jgi:inosine-uridine nucleoside N-ribohydrolase
VRSSQIGRERSPLTLRIDQRDGLAGIAERHPELNLKEDQDSLACSWFQTTDLSATELTLRLVESQPEMSITYIALGPLTNLAAALRANPSLVRERLGRVICMGGALDVPGNTSPVAECESLSR